MASYFTEKATIEERLADLMIEDLYEEDCERDSENEKIDIHVVEQYVAELQSHKPQHIVVFLTIEIVLPPQDIKQPGFRAGNPAVLCMVLVCLHQHELTVPALCPIGHKMYLWDIRLLVWFFFFGMELDRGLEPI